MSNDAPSDPARRFRLTVSGIVQGVGFRPYVYRLATECGLSGFVRNSGDGVVIDVRGTRAREFLRRLPAEAPPLALLADIATEELPLQELPAGKLPPEELPAETCASFRIEHSDATPQRAAFIPPDIALCDDCLRELFDPHDRRYRYPFITCTNCGPRFTITAAIPYDRPFTSMRDFPLCGPCAREYHDASDRRFHAQPNACPDCGPSLSFRWNTGLQPDAVAPAGDVIGRAIEALRGGLVLALRGLGGYHLAVDACNEEAVRELRRRKQRFEKPLAVMVPDTATARRACRVSPAEEALLVSPEHPIVILDALPPLLSGDAHPSMPAAGDGLPLAPSLAPGNGTLGLMLPYTPLHHLLLREGGFAALVMTSANLSEEPICIEPAEAELRLRDIADAFVDHNRDILQRCDDSVVRVMGGAPRPVRRSRGQVPRPLLLSRPLRPVLAVGGEVKNTLCVTKGRAAVVSQHIGDLENLETLRFFEESAAHLMRLYAVAPEAVAHDMHPGYLGTQWALSPPATELAGRLRDLPRIAVQHHHAHLASCLAENGSDERVIGVILDGSGYGTDGTSWGGEFLVGDTRDFLRAAHFETVPMPGGARAILQPWRMAWSWLDAAFGDGAPGECPSFFARRSAEELEAAAYAVRTRTNAPVTSGCGRLFDAAASLLGIGDRASFEAQAAIALEQLAGGGEAQPYSFIIDTSGRAPGPASGDAPCILRLTPMIRDIAAALRSGAARRDIAARMHATVVEGCTRMCLVLRERHGCGSAALSGGVFQNRRILEGLMRRLEEEGFTVLTQRQLPSNDGGISLGQAVVAQAPLHVR